MVGCSHIRRVTRSPTCSFDGFGRRVWLSRQDEACPWCTELVHRHAQEFWTMLPYPVVRLGGHWVACCHATLMARAPALTTLLIGVSKQHPPRTPGFFIHVFHCGVANVCFGGLGHQLTILCISMTLVTPGPATMESEKALHGL